MKNIKYILLVLAFTLLAPACSDFLELKPESQMLLDDFWKKKSDVDAVVRACYRAMEEPDFMWRVIVWGELRSDNVVTDVNSPDNYNEKEIFNVNIHPTNGNCSWEPIYRVINYCNTVLKYAPQVRQIDPNYSDNDLRANEAEVKAIRSLCYFYLVRTFREVPYVTEATISDDQVLAVAKSSPEFVLDKITADLLEAEAGALDMYSTIADNKGRMTKDAIRALLADVYLWKKDYSNCITYCNKLIDAKTSRPSISGGYLITPKYELIEEFSSNDIFYIGNSTESIFELQFSKDVPNNALSKEEFKKEDNLIHGLYGTYTYLGVVTVTPTIVENDVLFSQTDRRKSEFIRNVKSTSGLYPIFKYIGSTFISGTGPLYSGKITTSNWIFYRITDIMLMKAEALVQISSVDNLKKAIHLVNTTYMRANPTLLKTDTLKFDDYSTDETKEALDKLVLKERQRELMFEGKRWFDLVRRSERKNSTSDLVSFVITKYTSNQGTISAKLSVMNAIYLPIAEKELKTNTLLIQNPFYETTTTIVK